MYEYLVDVLIVDSIKVISPRLNKRSVLTQPPITKIVTFTQ